MTNKVRMTVGPFCPQLAQACQVPLALGRDHRKKHHHLRYLAVLLYPSPLHRLSWEKIFILPGVFGGMEHTAQTFLLQKCEPADSSSFPISLACHCIQYKICVAIRHKFTSH